MVSPLSDTAIFPNMFQNDIVLLLESNKCFVPKVLMLGINHAPKAKKPRMVRGLRLPQGLLSRFEVFVLAEQNVPHHKPAKDCGPSESSVWVSGLDSNCRDRSGGRQSQKANLHVARHFCKLSCWHAGRGAGQPGPGEQFRCRYGRRAGAVVARCGRCGIPRARVSALRAGGQLVACTARADYVEQWRGVAGGRHLVVDDKTHQFQAHHVAVEAGGLGGVADRTNVQVLQCRLAVDL